MHWTDPGWLATFLGVMIANIVSTLAGQHYTRIRIADRLDGLQKDLAELRHNYEAVTSRMDRESSRIDMLYLAMTGRHIVDGPDQEKDDNG